MASRPRHRSCWGRCSSSSRRSRCASRAGRGPMAEAAAAPWAFLALKRGGKRADWTDWVTYGYLGLGVIVMLAPVLWVVLSSFKDEGNLLSFPPTLLPEATRTAVVKGYERPLPLYLVKAPDGQV